MNEKISIVVPVYRTECFLTRAVNSLRNQSYGNLEIILVDDGSPDGCPALCDRLAAEDERIRVIHKQNEGVSRARYDGVCAATGKYLAFMDSDDTVEPAYIQTLYDAMHEFDADVATCGHRVVADDGTNIERFCFSDENFCISTGEALRRMLYDSCCSLSLCCKLYRTEWLREIAPSDLILGEDSYICLLYFLRCRRTAHTGQCRYAYYQHGESAVHANAAVKFYDYVRLYDRLLPVFEQQAPECMQAYYNRLIENNFVVFLKLADDKTVPPEMVRHIEDNIKKYRNFVLKDKKSHLRTKAACLLSSFGMPAVAACYKLFERLH